MVDYRLMLFALIAGALAFACFVGARRGWRRCTVGLGGTLVVQSPEIAWSGTPELAGPVAGAVHRPDLVKLIVAQQQLDLPVYGDDARELMEVLRLGGVEVREEGSPVVTSLKVGAVVAVAISGLLLFKVLSLLVVVLGLTAMGDYGLYVLLFAAGCAPFYLAYRVVRAYVSSRSRSPDR